MNVLQWPQEMNTQASYVVAIKNNTEILNYNSLKKYVAKNTTSE